MWNRVCELKNHLLFAIFRKFSIMRDSFERVKQGKPTCTQLLKQVANNIKLLLVTT